MSLNLLKFRYYSDMSITKDNDKRADAINDDVTEDLDKEDPDNDVDPADLNKLISKSGGRKNRGADGLAAEGDGDLQRSTTPGDMPSAFREMQRRGSFEDAGENDDELDEQFKENAL